MKKTYIFKDFQLNNTEYRKEIFMEGDITIPITNIEELPTDIAAIVHSSLSKTIQEFEHNYGNISDLSTLTLEAWLEVNEGNLHKHHISLILLDNVGLVNDARVDIDIQPKDDCYLSFATYCVNKLSSYLFAI